MSFKLIKRGERPFTSRELICQECGLTVTETLAPSGDTAEGREALLCPGCSKPLEIRGIQVGGVQMASFPDGYKRERFGFQQIKEAAKLEVDKAQAKPEERTRIEKEIMKLKEVKK